ncbi:diguanylate cyclase (GGDEF) domain-containing protein [Sporobacter termitidis DSM 10068]|uniref:Diguanylate cyclase (GGDEF) domain-containing protein n=1 Tax=Sporobacter termitidis DSM 10068 TaxID=1123282 RepID=A0A1M5Z0R0_9FIRM|nr:GGDEF domain-containing protein [Sporobacter termitidis]SHI17865.1 diguanylate cyclase (GGDEF) domain-containing protein [Sporobacter termitidis DSM 10068]
MQEQSKNTDNMLESQLTQIINDADIKIVFQPIISLRDGEILGYEALSRGPAGTPLQNPDALFGVAAECGKLWELEQLCRTKALETAYRDDAAFQLFLNVNPHVIHDDKFKQGFTKEYLQAFNIDPSYIYFEISEKNAVGDLPGFKKTIEHYKTQNYKIAIDDAGAGYSGLNLITDVHPHYIKLDMKLVRDIDRDAYKKSLVKSLYDFCCLTDVALIAEGIETEAELRALIEIGVHYGQGYYIQYPQHDIAEIDKRVIETIHACNAQKNHQFRHVSNFYIGNLCFDGITVGPNDLAGNVYNYFLSDENLSGVTVVDANMEILGAVTRSNIEHTMSGQYGFSLYTKRPISNIMNSSPLAMDAKTSIDVVSKLAMSRPLKSIYDFIVVTDQNRYLGVVTIKDLLEKTMEIEVFNSRQLNPLSGLPGNLAIEKNFERFITAREPHTILYIDLDNFKAYNDIYGFGNGDRVIRFVAQLLTDIIPDDNFIGHIGGDDFVVMLNTFDVSALCDAFIQRFDEGICSFYSNEDLARGYILTKNRRGEDEQYPIMSVSVASVSNRYRFFANVQELAEYASALKKQCKLIWRSCHITGK